MAADVNSWWPRAILIGAVIAAVLLVAGALGTRIGLWDFQVGFLGLAGGTILAAIGVIVGAVGLIASVKRELPQNRPPIYLGLAISVVILIVMGMQFDKAYSVPPIHNISTDLEDPPAFDQVVALRGEESNPLELNAQEIGPMQREAYPWVVPLVTPTARDEMFSRALAVVDDMGFELVNADPAAGIIEATDTTFWFGFKDDVAIRVRSAEAGTVVDVRSVSRVGLSDLGANAKRIGDILAALGAGA